MTVQRDVRDAWVEVDTACIQANIAAFQNHIGPGKAIYAAVKANGYGHGLLRAAQEAIKAGVQGLCVAVLDEALYLRDHGVAVPILVLGRIQPDQVWLAACRQIVVTAFQKDWVVEAAHHLSEEQFLYVHLKLDTGMGRIGLRSEADMIDIVREIEQTGVMHLHGVYTHFATADYSDEAYLQMQYERFQQQIAVLREMHQQPLLIHSANSAAAVNYPDKIYQAVRLGISMYGLIPSPDMCDALPFVLQPALSLHSRLIHVKKIEPGEGVSYGATHIADEPEWIGTIPIGYGDGWPRYLSHTGDVLIAGERMPIVGKICMDFFMVKLPREMPVGEQVTLIGRQDGETITADDIADKLETINYEVTCMIHERIPRIYV